MSLSKEWVFQAFCNSSVSFFKLSFTVKILDLIDQLMNSSSWCQLQLHLFDLLLSSWAVITFLDAIIVFYRLSLLILYIILTISSKIQVNKVITVEVKSNLWHLSLFIKMNSWHSNTNTWGNLQSSYAP